MAGGNAANLTKVLEVVHGDTISSQVEHRVQKGTSVSIGQDKSVAVDPFRIGRTELHDFTPKDVRQRCHTHRHARVTRIGLLHHVCSQYTYRVDTGLFKRLHVVQEEMFWFVWCERSVGWVGGKLACLWCDDVCNQWSFEMALDSVESSHFVFSDMFGVAVSRRSLQRPETPVPE